MKYITLFRHGKSDWEHHTEDYLRPLAARGYRQAQEMAANCELDPPDLLITSPAVRVYTTALIYLQQYQQSLGQLKMDWALYEANATTISGWLQGLPDFLQDLWLFGHNPGFNELTHYLSGSAVENITTSSYVRLEIGIGHWEELTAGCGSIKIWHKPNKKAAE